MKKNQSLVLKEIEGMEIEAKKKLHQIRINQEIANYESNLNRARSITVGTSFGGTTEIIIRGEGGNHMWTPMQPVEVIELIYQLAANVGCDATLKPREDFASWRDWKVTAEEKEHLQGHPPFVNDMAEVQQLGANMQKFEELNLKKVQDKYRAHANVEFDEDGNLENKVILKNGKPFMLGGRGGDALAVAEAVDEFNKKVGRKKYYRKKDINASDTVAIEEHKDGRES